MWYVKGYDENNEVVKTKRAKNKFEAGTLYDSMRGKYASVAVFEDEDYIDPCEL